MAIITRLATETDFPAVLDLIKGLAAFQGTPEKVSNTVEQMITDKHLFDCILAENEQQEIVGIATYFYAYYTWTGKALYLDDLYVKESCRGQRVGSLVLDKFFEIARENNCTKVRWQVSDWNEPAIAFYKKLGAFIDKEPYNCDFDEADILAFRVESTE